VNGTEMAEGDHDKLGFRGELDRMLRTDPFVPLDLVVTSGDRFRITNPSLLVMGPDVVTVYDAKSDAIDVIRANQVVFVRQRHDEQKAEHE